jgi:hypothetical protein
MVDRGPGKAKRAPAAARAIEYVCVKEKETPPIRIKLEPAAQQTAMSLEAASAPTAMTVISAATKQQHEEKNDQDQFHGNLRC